MAPKKQTIILSKIKDFYYGFPINHVKHGLMTFIMVNICVQEKVPNFALCAKSAKLSCFTVDVSENMFFILKNQAKPYQPCHEIQLI